MSANVSDSTDSPDLELERIALKSIFSKLGGESWLRKEGWENLASDLPFDSLQGVGIDDTKRATSLELSSNNLSGRLEDVIDDLLKLPALDQLWLAENSLEGPLPSTLAAAPALSILDLGSNKLSGPIPKVFSENSRLTWFEISGNQLSAFFRYRYAEVVDGSKSSELLTSATAMIPDFPQAEASQRPLSDIWNVHTVPSAMTAAEAAELVTEAEQWSAENGGWQTNRHRAYQTTDLDIASSSPLLLQLCNDHLEKSLLPLLSKLYSLPLVDLAVEDLFLVRYSAEKGEQNSLQPHRDDSELSFVVLLNDPKEFSGGGTLFLDAEPNLRAAPDAAGSAVFFCGRQLHAGIEIQSGLRYILAGFVRVHPSSSDATTKMQEMQQIADVLTAQKRKRGRRS
eukprot:TRINITY_DN12847_c7_g1_i1.p1 TRINITY_DN12847_c7_g1~~TRINITY_DN12847_c7_g1_i1.p1  ORF type:complete len:398 (-),score=85.19 TRINITY_DN12847_c7_g1_i1:100-1293(-)